MRAVDKIVCILLGDEENYDDDQLTQLEEYLDTILKSMLKECDYNVDQVMKRLEIITKHSVIAVYRAVRELDSKFKANIELTTEESAEYNKTVGLLANKSFELSDDQINVDLADFLQDLENLKLAAREAFEELTEEMQAEVSSSKLRQRF